MTFLVLVGEKEKQSDPYPSDPYALFLVGREDVLNIITSKSSVSFNHRRDHHG